VNKKITEEEKQEIQKEKRKKEKLLKRINKTLHKDEK